MDSASRGVWRRDGGAEFYLKLDTHTWSTAVEPSGYVTVTQAAQLTGASVMTIHRWISDGIIKPRNAPGVKMVSLSALRALAALRGFTFKRSDK